MAKFFPMKREHHWRQKALREHRRELGRTVLWWRWDEDSSLGGLHPIYDEGGAGEGESRRWTGPLVLPVIDAIVVEGDPNEEPGLEIVDALQIYFARWDLEVHGLGDLISNRWQRMRDRVEAHGRVWSPVRAEGTGKIAGVDSGAIVVCTEVSRGERVLDQDWPADLDKAWPST